MRLCGPQQHDDFLVCRKSEQNPNNLIIFLTLYLFHELNLMGRLFNTDILVGLVTLEILARPRCDAPSKVKRIAGHHTSMGAPVKGHLAVKVIANEK